MNQTPQFSVDNQHQGTAAFAQTPRGTNLRELMLAAGWSPLDARSHPRAYRDSSGTSYGTLELDGVRISLSIGNELAEERGAAVIYYAEEHTQVILRALIVDPDVRRKGKASSTLKQLCAFADATGTTLHLEIAPIEDKAVDTAALRLLYAKAGFRHDVGCRTVMVRRV